MSKIFDIIIVITAIIGTIIAIMALTGKKGAGLLQDSFGGIFSSDLPTDTAEIAANPAVVDDPLSFHDPTTDVQKTAAVPAGTYITAGTQAAPLAFTVVGGADTRPATGTLFGDQSGYGGITASQAGAGASGSRAGGTGSWTSAGYTTRY